MGTSGVQHETSQPGNLSPINLAGYRARNSEIAIKKKQHDNTSLAGLHRSVKELRKLSSPPDEQYKSEPVTCDFEATY